MLPVQSDQASSHRPKLQVLRKPLRRSTQLTTERRNTPSLLPLHRDTRHPPYRKPERGCWPRRNKPFNQWHSLLLVRSRNYPPKHHDLNRSSRLTWLCQLPCNHRPGHQPDLKLLHQWGKLITHHRITPQHHILLQTWHPNIHNLNIHITLTPRVHSLPIRRPLPLCKPNLGIWCHTPLG